MCPQLACLWVTENMERAWSSHAPVLLFFKDIGVVRKVGPTMGGGHMRAADHMRAYDMSPEASLGWRVGYHGR